MFHQCVCRYVNHMHAWYLRRSKEALHSLGLKSQMVLKPGMGARNQAQVPAPRQQQRHSNSGLSLLLRPLFVCGFFFFSQTFLVFKKYCL